MILGIWPLLCSSSSGLFFKSHNNKKRMVNKIIILGRVGKDPEVRRLESGAAVAKFSLATSETWKDKDGQKQEATEWHNVVLWRGLAEVCEKYVKKGDLIYIEGKVTYREYTDKETNQKKYYTEIVGAEMKMLGGKKEGSGGGYFPQEEPAKEEKTPEPVGAGGEAGGDLPF